MTDVQRQEPSPDAGELEMLTGWLDYHRATLELKCSGLTDEQLKTRSVPPSSLSLLGLVRHLYEVERGWFRVTMGGAPDVAVYYSEANRDGEFDDVGTGDAATDLARWRAECDYSRQVVADSSGLDQRSAGREGSFTLRWIVTHMVEEYARHNGHADLLRERIDGATGD
ncbi:DinB family protein [Motilibacter deserti]|uniref:DinB family protein n=1 Tax=Motilibacter deserti TaxID=2714956 RepID=A0ABX0H078_9ACTN|nr:DinB family protein [Motilibacter deserti]NHC15390.1 DinB family protein [Motilibacter deserti]